MCKNNLCMRCKTGRKAFELDSRAPFCPYIEMYKNDKCAMYIYDETVVVPQTVRKTKEKRFLMGKINEK